MKQSDFKSFAFQDLTRKEIEKFAKQYDGVDMAELMGADEDYFPFLIQDSEGDFSAMWWSKQGGMMKILDEDGVRSYATAMYLKNNAYPVFKDFEEAKKWAIDHDWPLVLKVEPSSGGNSD